MAALVREITGPDLLGARSASAFDVEVFTDLTSVEAIWRAVETAPGALSSPYQRFDWVAAYLAADTGGDAALLAARLRVFVLRDSRHRCRVLIPMRVARERGVRVARVIGEKHANFHMPLFSSREAAAIRSDDLVHTIVRSGRAHGIDVFSFDYQPCIWDGTPNPLAEGGQRCASDAYELMLGPDPEATLKRAYSADARKKMRAKERKLAELLGSAIEHRVAGTPEALSPVFAAFYLQKDAHMARIGAPNPYAQAAVRDFLAQASTPNAADRSPAIEVHALVAAASGRVLATFGGAVDGNRFSGMWTSFDPEPEIGRQSPGDLLLRHVIEWQARVGRRAFDLGVGEAHYKARVCDQTVELVSTVIPVTLLGRFYGLALLGLLHLKRRMKKSPRLWTLANRLRRAS